MILGPSGAPYSVPTTLHGDRLEATFAASLPGIWSIQVVAVLDEGPRPVLEALLFADADPPPRYAAWSVPGEFADEGDRGTITDAERIRDMVNAARESEGVAVLGADPRLELAATEHARAMQRHHELGHDAGDGGPTERMRRAGFEVDRIGENVAHAQGTRAAHRALWASPSHRGNVIDARFSTLGVGAVRDADGSVWVCELFGDFAEAGIARPNPTE